MFGRHRVEIIHNGLDLNFFKPINKTTAREIWDLPINKKLILFGAMNATSDHKKGFDLLYEGLKQLSDHWSDKAELIIFGASDLASGINWVLSDNSRHKDLCIKAGEKAVACFDIKKVARQYAELYREVPGREQRHRVKKLERGRREKGRFKAGK